MLTETFLLIFVTTATLFPDSGLQPQPEAAAWKGRAKPAFCEKTADCPKAVDDLELPETAPANAPQPLNLGISFDFSGTVQEPPDYSAPAMPPNDLIFIGPISLRSVFPGNRDWDLFNPPPFGSVSEAEQALEELRSLEVFIIDHRFSKADDDFPKIAIVRGLKKESGIVGLSLEGVPASDKTADPVRLVSTDSQDASERCIQIRVTFSVSARDHSPRWRGIDTYYLSPPQEYLSEPIIYSPDGTLQTAPSGKQHNLLPRGTDPSTWWDNFEGRHFRGPGIHTAVPFVF
jgi:hypothetical protein